MAREPADFEPTRRAALAAAGAGMIGAMGATAQTPTTTPASNDAAAGRLVPRTRFEGRSLSFDLVGLRVGCAEYDEGPTGCTVFDFPRGAFAVADIRGGAHCSIYTDYLRDIGGHVDAICLAGGSFYGLEASTGVASELLAHRKHDTSFNNIVLVSGAIIYDFRGRANSIYPDKELGRAALKAAEPGRFPLGRRGAGRSATCGKLFTPPLQYEPAGQGAAFAQVGATKLALFTVVNAVGSIRDRDGRIVRGGLNPQTGEREAYLPRAQAHASTLPIAPAPPPGNTTLTVLVTNRKLGAWELRQLARQVHGSMARAIDPFHTATDGDILFAAATGDVTAAEPSPQVMGLIASDLAWDAVLSCLDP